MWIYANSTIILDYCPVKQRRSLADARDDRDVGVIGWGEAMAVRTQELYNYLLEHREPPSLLPITSIHIAVILSEAKDLLRITVKLCLVVIMVRVQNYFEQTLRMTSI
jgi:hypothetical protein